MYRKFDVNAARKIFLMPYVCVSTHNHESLQSCSLPTEPATHSIVSILV